MKRLATAAVALLATALVAAAGATAGENGSGYETSAAPLLKGVAAGVTVTPIMNVGESLASGYTMESIPDGIAIKTRGQGRVDVYLNHETSLVPFPYNAATQVGRSDAANAMVSRLILNQHSAGVLNAEIVVPSSAGYQRFCSNFLAGPAEGFERELLLTNEEGTDFVLRQADSWSPSAASDPAAEQAGVVVAYDPQRKEYRTIYGMGRHNHENSVAVPGYGRPVVLSGDDTFSAPASQLYLYQAPSAAALWTDDPSNTDLYAFVSDNPAVNDYGDLTVGGSVSGRFIPVPDAIARGDQTGLENWSNTNNVFQFIRIEDIAVDRTDPSVVYFADTGEPRAIPDAASGRLRRGPSGTQGPYPNGRIFRIELDPANPLVVDSLSIVVDADAGGYGNPAELHQPDNVETTAKGILIQEDPGSHQPRTNNARIWWHDFATGGTTVVAEVDQSQQPQLSLGSWESSGIVDASAAFGPGSFLVDVQAHAWELSQVPRVDYPGILLSREAGQLALIRIPGTY